MPGDARHNQFDDYVIVASRGMAVELQSTLNAWVYKSGWMTVNRNIQIATRSFAIFDTITGRSDDADRGLIVNVGVAEDLWPCNTELV